MFLHWDVVALRVVESLSKPEVDHSDLVQRFIMIRKLSCVTNYDVVKLEVIIQEASSVDESDGIKELDTDLKCCLLGEGLVSFEQIVFKGSS